MRFLGLLFGWTVGLSLLLWSAFALAGVAQFPPNPGVLPGGGWVFTHGTTFADPPAGVRGWTNGVYGGARQFVATDAITLAARGGPLAVSAASRIALSDGVAAVGRCLVGGGPLACAVGSAAAIAYATYRANKPEAVPGSTVGTGLLDYDPGTLPVESDTWGFTLFGNHAGYPSAFAACAGEIPVWNDHPSNAAAPPETSGTWTRWSNPEVAPSGGCWHDEQDTTRARVFDGTGYVWTTTMAPPRPRVSHPSVSLQGGSSICPASIDPFNSAYNIPAGGAVGPDGKCPTARYNHQPKTPAQVSDIISAYPPPLPSSVWGDAVRDVIDNKGGNAPGTIGVTGPASQTGAPSVTTTTGPTGTTTITNTPTYNYNYAGNRITYNTTNVITTVNNDGTTTTTTTTTPAPAPGSAPESEDPCSVDPERIGCAKFGDPGTDKPIWREEVIPFSVDELGLPSGCPAPRVLAATLPQLGAVSWRLDYTPACDVAPVIRAGLLIMTAISCSAFIVRGTAS